MQGQLTFQRAARNTAWGEDSLLNKQCHEKLTFTSKELNGTQILQHSQKLTPNRLYVRPEIIETPEENAPGHWP